VKAWKRLTVHQPPNILTIALKRFQVRFVTQFEVFLPGNFQFLKFFFEILCFGKV
jgi:ubiquitin C-terminal hydrolase